MRAAWLVPWVNALLGTAFFAPEGVTLPFWIPFLVLFLGSALAQALSSSIAGRVGVGLASGWWCRRPTTDFEPG